MINSQRKQYAVIFDMDGVLIDSTYYIWESFRKLLAPYGIEVTNELIQECLGYSMRDQIEIWEKRFKVKLPNYNEFSKKAANIELEMMEGILVKDGLIILLNDLKKNNIKLAVGTASQKLRAVKILKLLEIYEYFDAVITSDDVTEHKPNPDVYLEAAKRISVKPNMAVVIEDAAAGIEAAKRAKMKSIGFLTEYNSKEKLKNADLLIHSFDDISVEKIKKLINK